MRKASFATRLEQDGISVEYIAQKSLLSVEEVREALGLLDKEMLPDDWKAFYVATVIDRILKEKNIR